ncbi:MAG: Hint domain-containing protein [Pseudomonadota bacterium]
MLLTVNVEDCEFAVATGDNVNVKSKASVFDRAPAVFTDLAITLPAGMADPDRFRVGDPFDLNWKGQTGHRIETAVVMRNETGSGGQKTIVFEGVDDAGVLTQVVWTPGFDLASWYDSTYSPGSEPRFWTSDQSPSYDHTYLSLSADAQVATPQGPVAAGKLRMGQKVLTVDDGEARLRWIGRKTLRATGGGAPVRFAPGTIGNLLPLRLSPSHHVLVRSPVAELMFGSSEVLVPAKSLIGGRGVRRDACRVMTYVNLLFDRHEILLVEGAAVESLLLASVPRKVITGSDLCLHRGLCDTQMPARPILDHREALVVIADRSQAAPPEALAG